MSMKENESNKGRYKTYSAEYKVTKIEEFIKSGKSEAVFFVMKEYVFQPSDHGEAKAES